MIVFFVIFLFGLCVTTAIRKSCSKTLPEIAEAFKPKDQGTTEGEA